jgi:drug/metabolite transporter (DMT)-like permease
LWQALGRFQLSEVLRWDFLAGLLGGVGGVLIAIYSPNVLDGVLIVSVGVVGVVIGAVVAGAAILGSFLDQAFIRKLRAINREPVRYLEPFLFTATVGIIGSIATIVLTALPPSTPTAILAIVAGIAGLFVLWTVASVLYDLDMLVQFIGLQADASEIDDKDVASLSTRVSNH